MLTVYGIETFNFLVIFLAISLPVATVLTVYGIETGVPIVYSLRTRGYQLQQCLPFTVLKLIHTAQQTFNVCVATVLTVYGIETRKT